MGNFLAKIKSYNEKSNNCGSDYKKNYTTLIILVAKKLPPIYDMFIQT
jgi:hypothetical protein